MNDLEKIRKVVRKILSEEMITSSEFNNNEFYFDKNNKSVSLEIATDKENEEQYRLNLILNFNTTGGYLELAFFFNITNKSNTQVTGNPKTMYDRNDVKNYLPDDLSGKGVFRDKISEMLKLLLKMEKPESFFMETYEVYNSDKQISYYLEIVRIIQEQNYLIEKQGTNIDKKYFWKFNKNNTINKELMTEEQLKWNEFEGIKRDEKYYKDLEIKTENGLKEYKKHLERNK